MSKSRLILSQTPLSEGAVAFLFHSPLFGIAAAIVMLWQGAPLFTTR